MRILILILLLPVLSFSQSRIDSVVVVNSNGDTIRYTTTSSMAAYVDGDSLAGRSTASKKRVLVSPMQLPVSTAQSTAIAARGYTLSVQALTSSPADAQTIYFGQLPKAPVTAAATSKVFIRKAGTIKMANIYCYSGTAGTNEAWVMSIRLNNTTDTQIASVSAAASERVFTNSSLNIVVAAGDYIEIKCVNPTWVTNPLTTIFAGYVYIE